VIPKIEEIQNESDVEQKLIYPILVAPKPHGLGLSHSHIRTKQSIKAFQIEKRQKKKLYYPDYVIVVSGLPVVIIEAKPPSDDLDEAYREARLYAIEMNATFPHCLNPATIIICSNGKNFIVGYWDSDNYIYDFSLEDLEPSNSKFSAFIEKFTFEKLQNLANELLKKITIRPFYKPTKLLGGQSVRNE
jgi:type I site-specific restriction endonuclease